MKPGMCWRRSLLLLSLAAGPALVQAAPCAEAAGPAEACEADAAPREADAGRRLAGVAIQRYPVHGTDAASLIADLRKRAPSGFHGFANWSVDYRYHFQPDGGRCRVTSVRTAIKGRVLVPQWVDAAGAPPALRADWERYEAALIVHEEGHIAHGQSLVRALQRELEALSAARCDELKQQADTLAKRLIEQHKELDRQYDARTRHGATQGARFEPAAASAASN